MSTASKEIVSEELNQFIAVSARQITARKLSVPAILFLESILPASGLLHAVSLAGEPVMSMLLGTKRTSLLSRLFESRKNIEQLINLIEQESLKH
ncbi:MAG: hypothetical protein D6719_10725 [Candidatus Dadabacteria bacterium]|nr:MAG: hypothetical protein D6719_10725 [Candidatus Dadabacteria bacterium]